MTRPRQRPPAREAHTDRTDAHCRVHDASNWETMPLPVTPPRPNQSRPSPHPRTRPTGSATPRPPVPEPENEPDTNEADETSNNDEPKATARHRKSSKKKSKKHFQLPKIELTGRQKLLLGGALAAVVLVFWIITTLFGNAKDASNGLYNKKYLECTNNKADVPYDEAVRCGAQADTGALTVLQPLTAIFLIASAVFLVALGVLLGIKFSETFAAKFGKWFKTSAITAVVSFLAAAIVRIVYAIIVG